MNGIRKKTKILLVYPNQMLQNLIPVGISLLSACLKQKGFNVEIFDTTFYKTEKESGDEIRVKYLQVRPFDLSKYGIKFKEDNIFHSFKKMVNDYKPDIIGYTITDDTITLSYDLMLSVSDYNAITIVGGALPTFAPEKMFKIAGIDIVCIGEGEKAIVELAEALENNKSYNNINNLWVKNKDKIFKNPLRHVINLDILPMLDLSIWEKERFYRPMQGKVYKMVPVFTDRGCSYPCTYCCAPSYKKISKNNQTGNYLRFRSIKKVIQELEFFIKKYSAEYIYFPAETFLLLKDNLFDEFINEYKKIKLPFWIQSRPEDIKKERIKRLIEIGADRISIGIESGNQKFRSNMLKRHFSNKVAIRCFDILAEEGLNSSVNNIIGFPDETRDMIFDTIALNRDLKTDSVSVFFFTPYTGTPLREYCIKKGYMRDNNEAIDRRKGSNLVMPQISSTELAGLFRTFPMYVRFEKKLYPSIRKAEKMDVQGNKEYDKLKKLFVKRFF